MHDQRKRAVPLLILLGAGLWSHLLHADPLPGLWYIDNGRSNTGRPLKAFFELKPDTTGFTGTLHWITTGGIRGQEAIIGTYDPANHRLTMNQVVPQGEAPGRQYTATVSADGKQMTAGELTGAFFGTTDNPGHWQAYWVSNTPLGQDDYPAAP